MRKINSNMGDKLDIIMIIGIVSGLMLGKGIMNFIVKEMEKEGL